MEINSNEVNKQVEIGQPDLSEPALDIEESANMEELAFISNGKQEEVVHTTIELPSDDEEVVVTDSKPSQSDTGYNRPFQTDVRNSELTKAIFVTADEKDKRYPILSMPVLDATNMKAYTDALPNTEFKAGTALEWANNVRRSQFIGYSGDFMVNSARNPKRKWEQGIKTDKGTLGFSIPRWKENDMSAVTGKAAILRVRALLGTGHVEQIALWHSGFHITLECPTDSSIIELTRRLGNEKVRMGRETWGYAFSNESSYMVKILTDFALEHIYTCTLSNEDMPNIRSHISSLDIPHIAWGMACMLYAKGFKYRRAILDANMVETASVDEVLNVHNMQVVDSTQLTEWQISHMANRRNAMSLSSIKRYRDEFSIGKGFEYEVHEQLKINVATPSLEKYVTNGIKWVDSIVSMVNDAFNHEPGSDERNEVIANHASATILRQYGHMVESITFGSTEITDQDTINEMLNDLSSNNELRPDFYKRVLEYMADSNVAMICIPSIPGKEIDLEVQRFANLIPIDAVSVFFILLEGKRQDIIARF